MIPYAKFKNFDISYDQFMQKFFITSKQEGRPEIGGFDKASDAIEFAFKRVI